MVVGNLVGNQKLKDLGVFGGVLPSDLFSIAGLDEILRSGLCLTRNICRLM